MWAILIDNMINRNMDKNDLTWFNVNPRMDN